MRRAHSVQSSSPFLRYGVAVVAVALALGLKLLIDPLIMQETPFLLVFAAVMISAWFGGLGPGLLATALAALITDYFFLYPINTFSVLSLEGLPLVVFVLEGVLVSSVVAALRYAREHAEESTQEARSHQENLRRSEKLYRRVVEQAEENIFLVDIETKRILEVNSAFHRSLGYTPEELKEMTLYDVVAHDRESVERNIQRIMREGQRSIGERQYRCKNGTLADMEVSASVVPYGSREAMCIVAHDVTERKRAEAKLRHSLDSLLALYEAGQVLGSTLEREQIGSKLLEITQRVSNLSAACIELRDEDQQLYTLRPTGSEDLWRRAHSAPEAEAARRAALETGELRTFKLQPSDANGMRLMGLCLPLRVRDRVVGLLEAYGPGALTEKENLETLTSLASQGASALENARLYEELAERERELRDLVARILVAEEEERRRVAYEVHDGLTQMVVAAHQRLQILAEDHPPGSAEGREELEEVIELVRRTVTEARRVIADLRPTTLDDFGLATAVRLQIEEMRAGGYEASYEETLGEEWLPTTLETALFRVTQEALTNVRKHSEADRVRVALGRRNGAVWLEVRDWGRGFEPTEVASDGGPGERVGLSSMRERVALLGGHLEIYSGPGEGTSVVVEVPLPVMGETSHGG
jgi:PAS domain S-box-containing protein